MKQKVKDKLEVERMLDIARNELIDSRERMKKKLEVEKC